MSDFEKITVYIECRKYYETVIEKNRFITASIFDKTFIELFDFILSRLENSIKNIKF